MGLQIEIRDIELGRLLELAGFYKSEDNNDTIYKNNGDDSTVKVTVSNYGRVDVEVVNRYKSGISASDIVSEIDKMSSCYR